MWKIGLAKQRKLEFKFYFFAGSPNMVVMVEYSGLRVLSSNPVAWKCQDNFSYRCVVGYDRKTRRIYLTVEMYKTNASWLESNPRRLSYKVTVPSLP